MEAIVLAGGFGTRLRPVIAEVPKVLAPVSGRPFLEIVLSRLSAQGFKRVILSLGHMAYKVMAHFGQDFLGMEIVFQVEDIPLGTGGAIRYAMGRCLSDHVYIFNGDTYLEIETNLLEDLWHRWRQPAIVAREVPDTSRYGRLKTYNQKVVGFGEKEEAGPGLINAGCYLFPIQILHEFPQNTHFSLEHDFLSNYVHKNTVRYLVSNGRFIDIGTPAEYLRAQNELLSIVQPAF
jgi:D-glycero-alpha-D-manno-heptose 1-phosphate guanylyltransferase